MVDEYTRYKQKYTLNGYKIILSILKQYGKCVCNYARRCERIELGMNDINNNNIEFEILFDKYPVYDNFSYISIHTLYSIFTQPSPMCLIIVFVIVFGIILRAIK